MTVNVKVIAIGAGAVLAAGVGFFATRGKKAEDKYKLGGVVARCWKERQQVAATMETQATVVADVIIEAAVQMEPVVPNDEVKVIGDGSGEPITSVSRIRVAAAPMFWSHFHGKISRDQVMEVSSEDFSSKENLQFSRGWHKCLLDGVEGILHVTKGNVSAVSFGGGVFTAVSTSASRFGTKGPVEIDADRAKAYLNGH